MKYKWLFFNALFLFCFQKTVVAQGIANGKKYWPVADVFPPSNIDAVSNIDTYTHPQDIRRQRQPTEELTELQSQMDDMIEYSDYGEIEIGPNGYDFPEYSTIQWSSGGYIICSISDIIIKQRSQSGKPSIIQATYYYKFGRGYGRKGQVEFFYNEGTPYYFHFFDYAPENYFTPQQRIGKLTNIYTKRELDAIYNLQQEFKENKKRIAKEIESKTYLETYLKQSEIKPEYDIKGCLIPKNEQYVSTQTRIAGYEMGVSYYDSNGEPHFISIPRYEKVPYYETRSKLVNKCQNTVILRGISKNKKEDGIIYSDASLTIKPDESVDFVAIQSDYEKDSAPVNSTMYFNYISSNPKANIVQGNHSLSDTPVGSKEKNNKSKSVYTGGLATKPTTSNLSSLINMLTDKAWNLKQIDTLLNKQWKKREKKYNGIEEITVVKDDLIKIQYENGLYSRTKWRLSPNPLQLTIDVLEAHPWDILILNENELQVKITSRTRLTFYR